MLCMQLVLNKYLITDNWLTRYIVSKFGKYGCLSFPSLSPSNIHEINVCLVKAMVFPVVIYGCESWSVKKAEHRRIDAFELWCWRRPLRVPWITRRSNQSILKEISPGCSLKGKMLKLKLQYFGDLMRRVDSLEKTLMPGRDWGQEEKGTTEDEMAGWHHRLDGRESEWTLGVGDGQGGLACCDSCGCKESDTPEWLNWTEKLQRWEPREICSLEVHITNHHVTWAYASIPRCQLQERVMGRVENPSLKIPLSSFAGQLSDSAQGPGTAVPGQRGQDHRPGLLLYRC